MIEKSQIANLHGLHIIASLMVAHAIPSLANIPFIELVLT
jgi:hypothetical protein